MRSAAGLTSMPTIVVSTSLSPSAKYIAIEYASAPVEQPADKTRGAPFLWHNAYTISPIKFLLKNVVEGQMKARFVSRDLGSSTICSNASQMLATRVGSERSNRILASIPVRRETSSMVRERVSSCCFVIVILLLLLSFHFLMCINAS